MEPLRPATRRKLQPLRSKKNTTVSQSPGSRISTRSVASSSALVLYTMNQPSTQASQTQAPTNMEPLRPATRRKLQPLRSKKNTTVSQSPGSRISTRSVALSSAQVGIPTRTSPRAKK
ncbi:hypothetical protein V2J09_011067 [Rumex salicifolius]